MARHWEKSWQSHMGKPGLLLGMCEWDELFVKMKCIFSDPLFSGFT